MQEAIVKLLAQGLSQAQVASVVGCSEGYISQVVSKEGIAELIEEQRGKVVVEAETKTREKRYLSLEDRILEKLENDTPFAEYKEVTKLLEILHRRKDPLPKLVQSNTQINNTVVLQIPQAAVPEIQLNENREVIGINNSSLAPLGAQGVKSLFLKMKLEQQEREEAVEALKYAEQQKKKAAQEPTITNLDDY